MKTDALLMIENWEERQNAEKLGMTIPEAKIMKTKMLFWKSDVKRANVDQDGNIIIFFNDDQCYEIEYSEKIWKELEKYFTKNEEK